MKTLFIVTYTMLSCESLLLAQAVRSQREMCRLEGHYGYVFGVAFLGDKETAITAGEDATVIIWRIPNGKQLRTYKTTGGNILALAISEDERSILIGCADCTARVLDLKTGTELIKLSGHKGKVRSVAFSPDGRLALTGSWDLTARLWDLKTGEVLQVLAGHSGRVTGVAFFPDGRKGVSAGGAKICIWDLKTGKLSNFLSTRSAFGEVRSLAVTSNGRGIVYSTNKTGSTGSLNVHWVGKQTDSFIEHISPNVGAAAVSQDGRRVFSGSGLASAHSTDPKWEPESSVRLWNIETKKELWCAKGLASQVFAVAISSDNRHALSSASDRTVRLWRLPEEK